MTTTRTTFLLGLAGTSLLVLGCAPKGAPSVVTDQVASDSLLATMTADKRIARVGEGINVALVARNTSLRSMSIEAATTAPMIVTVWRYDMAKGWTRVKEYPKVAIYRRQTWVLHGGKERAFSMAVPVEPDWPTQQMVKLMAELNGRTDARPYVLIEIRPKE